MKKKQAKQVMVFGVFDGLHPGHLHFFKETKKYGDKLIVVVARDKAVFSLKKKNPKKGERSRLAAVRRISGVEKAVLGDRVQSSYTVVKKYRPDVICLGYDQDWLKRDLEEKINLGLLPKIELIQITPHQPEELHSSLLRGKIES